MNVAARTGQFRPHYDRVRAEWPLLPTDFVMLEDAPATADGDGNAWCHGLNAAGLPIFQFRDGFPSPALSAQEQATEIEKAAIHEITHALEALLSRRDPRNPHRTAYWTWRGFPGTWDQARAESEAMTAGMARWQFDPGESFADAGRKAWLGLHERAMDYGLAKTQDELRAWLRAIAGATEVTPMTLKQRIAAFWSRLHAADPKTPITYGDFIEWARNFQGELDTEYVRRPT